MCPPVCFWIRKRTLLRARMYGAPRGPGVTGACTGIEGVQKVDRLRDPACAYQKATEMQPAR